MAQTLRLPNEDVCIQPRGAFIKYFSRRRLMLSFSLHCDLDIEVRSPPPFERPTQRTGVLEKDPSCLRLYLRCMILSLFPQLYRQLRIYLPKMSRRSPSPFEARLPKRRKLDYLPLTPEDYKNGVMLAPMVRSGARECERMFFRLSLSLIQFALQCPLDSSL